MKKLFFLSVLLLSFKVAAAVPVDVLSTEIGFEDSSQRKSLCLTIVRFPSTGSVLGILEPIEDCYYARSARKSKDQRIQLDTKKLLKITDRNMREYLQSLGGRLKFYFSDGE